MLDEEIQHTAFIHFQRVLGNVDLGGIDFEHLIDVNINNNLISSSDVELMVTPHTMEEVKAVTFGLHPNKAPRLDGMTGDLFQNCWEFMGRDIWMIVEDFRKKHKFVRELNHSMIVLIPKKEDCVTMADFRPISLCNMIYKIISKSMANRLKKIMPNLIFENLVES